MDLNLWKNKDELKKYLENLAIEYRYGCFEEHRPESCHLLGDYLLSIDKERKKAAEVYRMNCDEYKNGLSCDAFGRMAIKGQGMAGPDYKMALEYFTKGCEFGEPRACYHGGQMLGASDKQISKTIVADPDKSLQMLEMACLSRKVPDACSLIHSNYLRGFLGRPPDMRKAADYATIGCDQNEIMCCFNLSRMYHLGDGIEADQDKSAFFKERVLEIKRGVKQRLEANKDAEPDAR